MGTIEGAGLLSRRTLHSAVLLTALGLTVSAQGCANVVGIESNPTVAPAKCSGTVRVRIASDFSGTATDIAIPYFFGQYDYLRKLNATGGIMGCQIDIGVADNNYTPAGTQKNVDDWRAKDPQWATVNTVFIFGTGPTTQVGPSVMGEKKVIIPGSYAGSLATPVSVDKNLSYHVVTDTFLDGSMQDQKKSAGWPYVFFPATDYSTAMRLGIQAAWQIQPGRMAMAHESADKCAYCVDPLDAGRTYLANLSGMSLGRDLMIPQTSNPADEPKIAAAVQAYMFGEWDPANPTVGPVGGEVGQASKDPNYEPAIWFWSGNSVYASSILGKYVAKAQADVEKTTVAVGVPDTVRANYKTKWKLRVMANNWGIGETTPGICGPACNNDNFYGLFPVPRYADIQNSGLMNDVIALHDEYAGKDTTAAPPIPARTMDQYRDVRYVQGYASVLMWKKGMEAAILAGHRSPTGEDLKDALETFNSLDMGGMTAVPISFSPQDHRPQSGEVIYKLDGNGQFAFVNKFNIPLVGDWLGW